MIEHILSGNLTQAIIVRSSFKAEGIHFVTPNSYTQQLGFMCRDKGYEIQPHLHKITVRNIKLTNEFLYVKYGSVKVDFYDNEKHFTGHTIIKKGDCILLIEGGHGFKFLEKSELIEVKQGPYVGEEDKERF